MTDDIVTVFDYTEDGHPTLYAVTSMEDGVSLLFDGHDEEPTADSEPAYFLPDWWDWHTDPALEIPPGLLAICCVIPAFGGGTEVVGGAMRGNTQIHGSRQAQAAARQHGSQQVAAQLNVQSQQAFSDTVQRRR